MHEYKHKGDHATITTSPSSANGICAKLQYFLVRSLTHRQILAPVYTKDTFQRQQKQLLRRVSWSERFIAWIRYYNIQWRWDIERKLAKLFHHRWGGNR